VAKVNKTIRELNFVAESLQQKRATGNVRVDDHDLDFLILRDRLARKSDPRSHRKQFVSATWRGFVDRSCQDSKQYPLSFITSAADQSSDIVRPGQRLKLYELI
jgi:hypothetical protein